MGKSFTRGDAWLDTDYIVNLTTNIVGKSTIFMLASDYGARNGYALRALFLERVINKICKMSNETLGRICAYGGPEGLHAGHPCQISFLNMTGYTDVMRWKLNPLEKSGRELLEELAALTVVCVLRDIVMQGEWQLETARALEDDAELDRGMRNYIHRGHR